MSTSATIRGKATVEQDPETSAIYIKRSRKKIVKTEGFIAICNVDFDKNGDTVGIELIPMGKKELQ